MTSLPPNVNSGEETRIDDCIQRLAFFFSNLQFIFADIDVLGARCIHALLQKDGYFGGCNST